ncbi:hypothetical protein H9655_08920 [Cytobacillus sp. Sa5YUA1]|uniref:Uncharacterized protein n=1 Tax=Cytobacillus stercorigallinarum TaxID=2762240 RepID=A0ABR8QP00_9BACI|nr:hypothetical protein [Cytobacillus stercorigallinarum]MBD7937152.1 hypothetical protein [Cytobacillus stercorigallinarum]
MISNKPSYIANFNLTFGKNDQPMLSEFESIILPAFTQENPESKNIKLNKNSPTFFFEEVRVTNVKGEYVLAGLIVKSTKLEVKSRIIDGKLTRTNLEYPTDPYSYFIINLKNHRMVLVKNQNGSPTLKNFASTASLLLKNFIRTENEYRNEDNKLPYSNLNVVAIPFKGKIFDELKKAKKINQIQLKFYPLNGDIIDNETVDDLTESLNKLGSKTGHVQFNSPDNDENVGTLIEDTKGLLKPTVRVTYENGSKATLKDDSFTEVVYIPVSESESFYENIDNISGKVINKPEFSDTSEENKSIYERAYSKIENIYNRLFKNI